MGKKFEWTDDLVSKFHSSTNRIFITEKEFREEMISFKEEHSPKRYPEGILKFASSLLLEEWQQIFESGTYDDWCSDHLSVGRRIESVKNSCGEMLTVGDKTEYGKIIRFEVDPKYGIVAYHDQRSNLFLRTEMVHPLTFTKKQVEDAIQSSTNSHTYRRGEPVESHMDVSLFKSKLGL